MLLCYEALAQWEHLKKRRVFWGAYHLAPKDHEVRPDQGSTMKKAWEEIESLLETEVDPFLQKLKEAAQGQPNEATFRQRVASIIGDFCTKAEVQFIPKEEYSLAEAKGRADTVFNRLILEYKRPGVLKPSPDHPANKGIIENQLKPYIQDVARKENQDIKRMAGLVLDGNYFIFVRRLDKGWREEKPAAVNTYSVKRFLRQLVSLGSGTALTPENLIADFGVEQSTTQRIIKALVAALEASSVPLVDKLFEQWRTFFSQVIEYREAYQETKLKDVRAFALRVGIDLKVAAEAERFFFAMHTYFALLVKCIAWLAVSRYIAGKIGGPDFGELSTLPTEQLKTAMERMEKEGGIFKHLGIRNLLEGDFFAWYLHTWDENIDGALRDLLTKLNDYDPTTLDVDPDETRDLLKKLYHRLMPREIRHNLGEYYTPDWLAQRLLNQIDNEFFTGHPQDSDYLKRNLLKLRFLDPACGSGTFPVLVIKRIKEVGAELFIPEERVLEAILNNVIGIDLNPLAVIAARTNYLLALGELLRHWKGDHDIPVYLADSVVTPAEGEGFWEKGKHPLYTSVGTFEIPKEAVSWERINELANILEEDVKAGREREVFLSRARSRLRLAEDEFASAKPHLQALYKALQDFEEQKLNGIWARIIKNGFAPLFVGQFDYVVGNPPWVNWENLPQGYRQRTKPLWDRHKLFPHKGYEAIMGKAKDDISILMTYVAIDSYLKNGGKLGFLITQSVFKTAGAGQGFRRFTLGDSTPIKVIHVDDMVELNPFEGASNRTSVVILQKGSPTEYPVPYTYWRKILKGRSAGFDQSLPEVEQITERKRFYAEPVDSGDKTSPWLTGRPKAIRAVKKILGKSDYQAHAGVYSGGANAVYWLNIEQVRPDGNILVTNITEGQKRDVEPTQAILEPDLIYPLLRGRDVRRWLAQPKAWILVTHLPGMRLKALPEKETQLKYPKTWEYLKKFEGVLRTRAAFKRYFGPDDPFYSMFDVGDYTFEPYKVVWPWISAEIRAAVTCEGQSKPVCPEHNTSFVAVQLEEEAHFICGLLNSAICDFAARASYSGGGGGIASPALLERIRIPSFQINNENHVRLAALSQKAHQAASENKEQEIREIQAEIDLWAAKLWGLTDEELKEIQLSLKELVGDR